MRTMTDDQRRAFLSEGTRTAKLSAVRADGRPHISPVWFVLDGDDILFTTWHDSVKGRNIVRDGRISICVDDERPPFAYVVIEGTATVSTDMAALLTWATKIGGRYMGADQADIFGKRNAVEGGLLVRLTPTKSLARDGIADWD